MLTQHPLLWSNSVLPTDMTEEMTEQMEKVAVQMDIIHVADGEGGSMNN